MMKRLYPIALLVFLFPLYLRSATINVPADQSTIIAAVSVALAGDTILVAPGTYPQSARIVVVKLLHILSSGGSDSTIITPTPGDAAFGFLHPNTVSSSLSGFTFTGGTLGRYIDIVSCGPRIMSNVFRNNSGGNTAINISAMIVVSGGISSDFNPTFTKNLFYDNPNSYSAIYAPSGPPVIFVNNTVDRGWNGLEVNVAGSVVENNIISNCGGTGLLSLLSTLNHQYNDIWNMGTANYGESLVAGATDISVDPLFVDTSSGNYTLQLNSPCIDAGDPDPALNDPDGTRNDIGAFPVSQNDSDGDGIADVVDNCPDLFNSSQMDFDRDGIGNGCDNCFLFFNPLQADIDNDGLGDKCDRCPNDPTIPCCCTVAGDAFPDDIVNIVDVTFLITRIFAGGPAPVCNDEADANGDGSVNIADVTYLIARIFASGPAPVCGTTGQ